MSRVVVPEYQTWENGGDKVMERREKVDKRWYSQNMHPTF